jgi:hypothetical protein
VKGTLSHVAIMGTELQDATMHPAYFMRNAPLFTAREFHVSTGRQLQPVRNAACSIFFRGL